MEGVQVAEQTNYPLTIVVAPGAGRGQGAVPTSLRVSYDTQRFERATIQRLLGHFLTVLQQLVDDPQQQLQAVSLLTEAEREQLLVQWNATQCDYLQDLCVHQLFEQQVERTPDAIAVVFEDTSLTYRELNGQANHLAHRLLGQEVGPDVLVGVCMERSLELVIALLAILKAGGAYVPLDPELPQERLTFMLEDAQVPVVLTQAHLHDLLGRAYKHLSMVELICLEADDFAASEDNPNCWVQPENLAYLIYTSGSTGKPKGAMNTHRGLCNRLVWMQDTYQLTQEDRVLQKTPLSFDVSVWEFFWPLMTGASLIVARPEGHRDPTYLRTIIAEQQVTTLHFVPSMLHAFLLGNPNLEDCTSLRQVICSGEALTPSLQASFFAHVAEAVTLHNLYGPTEAAIDVTFWQCQRNRDSALCLSDHRGKPDGHVPIGRPIANTQIYLLDRNLSPVPIGVTGELYVGGEGLARGYARRPELTAERFIANPWSFSPGARLYRTGDLACYLPDGTIEYLGRIDSQVKLRGYRIELGEIETTLQAHPSVQEAVVVLREESETRKYLIAYVVARTGDSPETSQMQGYLREQLPDYMVPTNVVFLEALPLTPNGKVDRNALGQVQATVPTTSGRHERAFMAPRKPVERTLAAIWQQVLGIRTQVGIHENFFALGGDSILSMLVIAHARQAGLRKLTLKQLFQYPTIAQLAMVAGPVGSGLAPDRWQ